jgi:hypothetical protein
MNKNPVLIALLACIAIPVAAQGSISAKQSDVMKQLFASYTDKAKAEAKQTKGKNKVAYQPFSADAGREFYLKRRTWQTFDYTCSACHTDNPSNEGRHTESKKPIKPLAPAANPERFTDADKVEKSFAQHCFDLYDRDCKAQEKGDYIAYMMSLK